MTAPYDRTADQFDAWLETASQRASRPSSPNGATDPAAYDLVTTAHAFHSRMNAAEQRTVPAIPAKAIWEDVMSSTTAGTISIPALAPSGADRPPKAPTPPITDSAWPKPGHWAVPAFLVIALMIGILWFYSSFFGATDPGPKPTSQPGFAFSTPTDDMAEWLVPLEDVDCGSFGTPAPNSTGFDLGQNTSASIDVDAYLPFGEAPALEQRQIAERYLHLFAACPRASTDSGITDGAFMMPFEHATDQQIEAAQQISAALPIQDYREYFILQPEADTAGEDRRLDRTVALPGDVIQLADGRLGVPARFYLIGQDSVLDVTGGREYATTMFLVFDRVDGHWLVDEMVQVCIGDCNEYWAVLAGDLPADILATPIASPVTFSTPTGIDDALLDPGVCTVTPLTTEEISALQQSPVTYPNRQYGPTAPVDLAFGEEIAALNREFVACAGEGNWRSMASQRLIYEARATGSYAQTAFALAAQAQGMTAEEYIAWHRDLSATLLPGAISDYVVLSHRDIATTRGRVVQPHHVIQLADGRIGAPESAVLSADSDLDGIPLIIVPFNIYIQESDGNERWVLDESLLLCVGDCGIFYEQMARDLSVLPAVTPSPAASPVATPASDVNAQWLVNRDDIDCERNENSLPDTFVTPDGTIAIGDYLPFAEADPETQVAVARQFQLLAANCTSSPGGTPLISEDMSVLPAPSQRPVSQEQLDFAIALSDAVSTGDPLDFILEAEPGLVPSNGFETVTASIGVMFPESVVQLPDGRYGAPLHLAIESTDPAGTREMLDERGWVATTFHIFTVENGVIQLDEVVWICLGDCDDYWASYNIAQSPTASPAASPVATPVASPIATPASARTIRFS